ncbi:MAG: hypothetical protein ACE5LH_02515 [Fidelibacterota bacterium]
MAIFGLAFDPGNEHIFADRRSRLAPPHHDMSNQDFKAVFGYLILTAAVIGVVLSFVALRYYLAIIFVVSGLLVWMIYVNLVQVRIHRQTGAVLIIFGVLLASAVFMAFGLEQDMWGGYRLKPEGAILSVVILLFGIMPGLIFYYFHKPAAPVRPPEPGAAGPAEAPQVPSAAPSPPPEPPETAPPEEYAEWAEQALPEGYEYYDPEMLAAYYGEEYDEEEEENDESG